MKWVTGAKKYTIVAGLQIEDSVENYAFLSGIIVDQSGNVYVAETNKRITRWIKGTKEGTVVVGGGESNTFETPLDLSFDKYGNLYVVDADRDQVLKFLIDSN